MPPVFEFSFTVLVMRMTGWWCSVPGLLRGRAEAVWRPLPSRAVRWGGVSCPGLPVFSPVHRQRPRLVPIPLCYISAGEQPLPGSVLPRKDSVRGPDCQAHVFVNTSIKGLCVSLCLNMPIRCVWLSAPKPSPSFQRPVLSAPLPADEYRQGSPIFTLSDQYFTIPQVSS